MRREGGRKRAESKQNGMGMGGKRRERAYFMKMSPCFSVTSMQFSSLELCIAI